MFVLVVLPTREATSVAGKEGAPTGMSPRSAENRQGPGIRERETRVRGQERAQETKGSLDSQDEGSLAWERREREEKSWENRVGTVPGKGLEAKGEWSWVGGRRKGEEKIKNKKSLK